jgi:hypothetical protein
VIAALLLAAAPPSAVDAENAFARDAQRIGQWSAFRKYADHDAVMFSPHAVWARDFLMDRRNPAESISWRPAHSFVSCDGRTAVNTGPWFTPKGKIAGYFTTVWQRDKAGWRWVYDGGIPAPTKLPVRTSAQVQSASCAPRAPGPPVISSSPLTSKGARATPRDNGGGESADKTLEWDWKVAKSGARTFRVYLWTGRRYVAVVNTIDPAP